MTPSPKVTANLGCELDYIWNQLGTPVRDLLDHVIESGAPTLYDSDTLWWLP